ncbi:MAG: hypothetical protein R3A78_12680 [Polyangiales bacterium]
MKGAMFAMGATMAVTLAACTTIPATEILVEFYASSTVRTRAEQIQIRVETQNGDAVLDRTDPVPAGGERLARVPVIPKGDDASRVVTVVGVLLDADGTAFATKRVVSRFTEDARRVVRVTFDEDCVDVDDCGQGRTCHNGACVGACFVPVSVDSKSSTDPTCGDCDVCTAGACEPATDGTRCGCEGDVCQAGSCAVEVPIRSVALGSKHSCALSRGGQVYCWGSNFSSELGQGVPAEELEQSWMPLPLDLPTDDARMLTSRGNTSCLLHFGREYSCWGTNQAGQFGDGEDSTTYSLPEPQYVATPQFVQQTFDLQTLSLGSGHGCTLAADARVWCWGLNSVGQLGRGTAPPMETDSREPVPEPMVIDGPWRVVDAGGEVHSCAIDAEGVLWCFGGNVAGQLGRGNGSPSPAVEPVPCDDPACPSAWDKLAVGYFHNCAIGTDESLWCWGGNTNGQVGDGTMGGERTDIVNVLPGMRWAFVATGRSQSCAIEAEHSDLYCWGGGGKGQLGTGTRLGSSSPVKVPSGAAPWTSMSLGDEHSCAVRADGSLWCWGNNEHGEVGVDPVERDAVVRPHRVCFPEE